MAKFWQPQFSAEIQKPIPNAELLSDKPIPTMPSNIVPTGTGRFRAYANQNGARIYLGTHDSLPQAIQAQTDFKLEGKIPHKERIPQSALPLRELVERMLAELGEYVP